MLLFEDDMMVYIENPKDAIRKLSEVINEFGKFARYKINTQQSVAFLSGWCKSMIFTLLKFAIRYWNTF